MSIKQRTLRHTISYQGVSLHAGQQVPVEIHPAEENAGITFRRTDIKNAKEIPANANNVVDTRLATTLGDGTTSIAMVEHTMAALYGLGIDNAKVTVNGPEMPILDGSADPILQKILEAGTVELQADKKFCVIQEDVEYTDPKDPTRFIRISPADSPILDYNIDFPQTPLIGKQSLELPYTPGAFCEEIAYGRTFCVAEDIPAIRAMGLIKGGSLENALVVSNKDGVLNPEGMRDRLECVRHKTLDFVGDLYQLGHIPWGSIKANKAGHDLHNKLARVILANPHTYALQTWEELVANKKEIVAPSMPNSFDQMKRNIAGPSIA